MTITGAMFIAGRPEQGTGEPLAAYDPTLEAEIEPTFRLADPEQLDRAATAAGAAFRTYRATSPGERSAFLEAIASAIEQLGDELLDRASAESGLPLARLIGERARTTGQLRLFAAVARDGDGTDATIDRAQPDRAPAPRADIRRRAIGVGPVAVFGASNFPLAFSVAGGDTASALAAGCPVVVKGHGAHPGTSELVAGAVVAAARSTGMPDGVFSLVLGDGPTIGQALVKHPAIKAVAFTGSRRGGLALVEAAAARPVPIPVFAEMSSTNPVVLLPGALDSDPGALGRDYAGSLMLGAGQFCTNPGLVLGVRGAALDGFTAGAAAAVAAAPAQTMLTPAIRDAYVSTVAQWSGSAGVDQVASGARGDVGTPGTATLLTVGADEFLTDPALREEAFGPAGLVVECADVEGIITVLEALDGQLTATVRAAFPADDEHVARLIPLLEEKVGRIVVNGWPTGVEVGAAMVHGGPFPATTDSRFTSVGASAHRRFLRPVAYQDAPDHLLPEPLQDANPWSISRVVDPS
ncbi:aldehyde dehydrogenase (NADP(+)) [Herbiconiux sp. CPCC 203407]|uniref:Aldehyde dehydrogenase (NADP(+)) n=1 Tax=Herbiconiux oxytropis TaxID=2970915 RepID=A0AA41XC89_9MICO|nr:aldehyde dehydrogenase (NADP(+)) [Herbiconiux oxytropis]MCS5721991.1 aldehyde dehydrogenase (NADP(+)) [Herbiconiux oxytropis]MCS5725574.1 aldehyde dehydrogenase (NADP(+)) [Herbiconiux oxytropis]